MRIRTQILLAYTYLVALLLAGAMGAAVSFYQLGRELDGMISSGGTTSNIAMETSFRRAVRKILENTDTEAEPETLGIFLNDFEESLQQRLEESSRPAEQKVLARMQTNLVHLEEILSSRSTSRVHDSHELDRLLDAIDAIAADFNQLGTLDEKMLLEADRHLRTQTRIRTMAFSLLVVLALLSLVVLSRILRRSLLDRLDELRQLAHEIHRGHSHRRAFPGAPDELGLLAQAINKLLDSWDAERQEAVGRELRRKRILLALLNALGKPAAIALPDGRILASTIPDAEPEIEKLLKDSETQAQQKTWKIRPLKTPDDIEIGRLITKNK